MSDDSQRAEFASETDGSTGSPSPIGSPDAFEYADATVDRAVDNLSSFSEYAQAADAVASEPSAGDDAWDVTYGDSSAESYESSASTYGYTSARDEDAASTYGSSTDTGDEASYEGEQDEENPLARAGNAARVAQQSIADGIQAFKNVREARQRHSDAREELRFMRESYDEHAAELQHRIDIEQRYPQIVAEQTAELQEASALVEQNQQRATALDSERADLESQLSIMKDRHEDQLRPYLNVAESTKGRADDAARALADMRRAVKSAENNLAEASKRRDQRISSANRVRDAAQDRLRRIEADIASQQAREEVDTAALERLQNERVSVQTNLDSAIADVPVVTEEANQAVATAQQRLFDQNQQLAQVEREAEAAKKEATERRAEYDNLLKQAQEEERALSEKVKLHVTASEQARKEIADAQERVEIARNLLDEAEEIHATPQETIALRDIVSREQTDIDVQQDTVDELAATERALRKGTFKQRLMLILGAVAFIVLVIAIVVAVVLGKRASKAKSEPVAQPTQVETTKDADDDDATDAKDEKATDDADEEDDADSTTSDDASASDDDAESATSGTVGDATTDDAVNDDAASSTNTQSKTQGKTTTTSSTSTKTKSTSKKN